MGQADCPGGNRKDIAGGSRITNLHVVLRRNQRAIRRREQTKLEVEQDAPTKKRGGASGTSGLH